jgi:hypothetical protein
MSNVVFPRAFVWTKIQADAGQQLNSILIRKDLEGQAGGTFWWGIGESKAKKIRLLTALDPRPAVFFSQMVTAPHTRDSNPGAVLLWQAYKMPNGAIVSLPPHAIITSRAHDKNGNQKTRHYALVCENPSGYRSSRGRELDTRTLRNFGDGGKGVGSSQVTAVVERTTCNRAGRLYPITAYGTLIAPYAVQLSAPRLLSSDEKRLLDDVSCAGKTSEDWMIVARQLHRSPAGTAT